MRKRRIGIVGAGMIAQAHMRNFADDPRTELAWVADTNPDTLRRAAAEFRIPRATADYREMLADASLDAVAICTPPLTHVPMAVAALRAGKHLLVEKPLATTVADARRLLAETRRRPRLRVSGCSCRHARLNPKFRFVRAMIRRGDLGDVYFIHHRAVGRQGRGGIEYNPSAKWFLDRRVAGGGPMYDWGVYDLSFHLGLVGEPELRRVEAFCAGHLDRVDPGTPVYDAEEHGGALLVFANGLRYFWERASNAHGQSPNRTTIYGTKGGLAFGYCSWDPPEVEFFDVARGGRGKARRRVLRVPMRRHRGDMPELGRAFVDYLCDGGPAPMPLDLEVRNLAILHRVYRAAGW